MHVHVAVDDPDKAIQVSNGLILPPAASSWRCRRARRSGAASRPGSRPRGRWSSRPSRARACRRGSRATRTFAELVGQLERTGCIADYTHIWWDIRPHPRLGTVELRICDAVTRVEDVVAIAAYYQSLVKMLSEHVEAAGTAPSFHRILTTENKWLAARHGLEAPVMDLVTGPAEPGADRAARPAHAARPRAARARARLASASSRGSPRSSRAATAPSGSSGSGTRTATSPRSSRISPPRQRSAPSVRVAR